MEVLTPGVQISMKTREPTPHANAATTPPVLRPTSGTSTVVLNTEFER